MTCCHLRFVAALALFLIAVTTACAIEPIVVIRSPDKQQSYIYGSVESRKLLWSDKEKKLYALITVSNERYASGNEAKSRETLKFYLPGVELDAAGQQFFVRGKNNEVIPFAVKKKELFFTSIQPVRNAVVHIIRTRGNVEVSAEIYKPEEVAAEEAAEKSSNTNEWQKLDLDKALGN